MAHHKFKVGQIVESATGLTKVEGRSTYEIVSLLPSEGQDPRYRIKRAGVPDRVAAEAQLTFIAEATVKPDRRSISVSGSKPK